MTARRFSDAVLGRRALLKAVGCAAAGVNLPLLLRARLEAATASKASHDTAVIFVYLGGGPSQHETYDPKPDAPLEFRGPAEAIRTAVPGVFFSELAPEQARIADRLAIVRSVHHEEASHIAYHLIETGYRLRDSKNILSGEMPSVGATVSKSTTQLQPGRLRDMPAYVSLPKMFYYSKAHYLGGEHNAFAVDDDPSKPDFRVGNLALHEKLSSERLAGRRALWHSLDRIDGLADLHGSAQASDEFTQRAFDLLLGERAQRAFDLTKENDATRERYGRTPIGQRLLLARRLVEAGVPFVAIRTNDWDDHEGLEARMRARMPEHDRGLAALIGDLGERSLSRQVLVVAMGEFGRTPRVNLKGGRDHWPAVNSVLLAGGAFRMGQVIGASDARGGAVADAPYRPENVLAMVYRHLGIDPATTFRDFTGRPRYLLEERAPIAELV